MMDQRFLKIIAIALLIFSGVSSVTVAHAERFRHGGWGWRFGTGFVGGVVIGSHFARPYYNQPYPPYAPYPPMVIYQQPQIIQSPPVYDQVQPPVGSLQASPPMMQSQSIWYLCESANNFYPNVLSCPEPWKLIDTNPSSAYSAPPSPLDKMFQ